VIAINEIYGPVSQGEGKSAGKPVMFLRLSGCNLACIWCDTPYTWNWIGAKFVHPDKYDPKVEVHKMEWIDIFTELISKAGDVKALVISGGEPMLQQDRLIPLLQVLKENNWWIEIETNGTIAPTEEFSNLIEQFNCSPKTENSGPDNPLKDRLVPSALQAISGLGEKAIFKFVVQSQEDLPEIMNIVTAGRISAKQVFLMPEGRTAEEQLKRQEEVKQMCKVLNYNFSPRLHILEFGNKRGV
jgi:7-carboxy-7-deazaguanine synthase